MFQAGKTGAYLHFAYLLHRMLVRLKRVDVYDNRITYTPSIEAITARWPDHNALVETKFVGGFLDMRQVIAFPTLTTLYDQWSPKGSFQAHSDRRHLAAWGSTPLPITLGDYTKAGNW